MNNFQQFAERCRLNAAAAALPRPDDPDEIAPQDPEEWREAERHARLLQQIWEMVKDDVEWDAAKWGMAHESASGGSIVGINACKSAVRSLLVGQQEKT